MHIGAICGILRQNTLPLKQWQRSIRTFGDKTQAHIKSSRKPTTNLFRTKCNKKSPKDLALNGICITNKNHGYNFMDEFRLNSFFPLREVTSCKRNVLSVNPQYFRGPNAKLYSKSAKDDNDKGGPVKQSGGRIGKIDAASEQGFFHKLNLARLKQAKLDLEKMNQLNKPDKPESK